MFNEVLHKGKVIDIKYDIFDKLKEVIVETENGESIIIDRSEMTTLQEKMIEVNDLVKFIILDDGVASAKRALPSMRRKVLSMLGSDEEVSGMITSVHAWGAFISIDGYICSIQNSDYASDHTRIADTLVKGDVLTGLKISKVTGNNSIYVALENKYQSKIKLDETVLKSKSYVYGVVINIKRDSRGNALLFIGIPNELNLLASQPNFTVRENDAVICKVSKIDKEAGVLRGKIIKVK